VAAISAPVYGDLHQNKANGGGRLVSRGGRYLDLYLLLRNVSPNINSIVKY